MGTQEKSQMKPENLADTLFMVAKTMFSRNLQLRDATKRAAATACENYIIFAPKSLESSENHKNRTAADAAVDLVAFKNRMIFR